MDMSKRSIIMVKMDPPQKREPEWNEWYNHEHIPARMQLNGFLGARRFTKTGEGMTAFSIPDEAKYLSLYELSSAAVVKEKSYLNLIDREAKSGPDSFEAITLLLPRFARGVYEQIFPDKDYFPPDSKYVLVFGHEVPRNHDQEFNAWYNTEHIAGLVKVPGVFSARRFKLNRQIKPILGTRGYLPPYLTIYDMESPEVLESEPWMKSGFSPWSTWVRSWFKRTMCMSYELIHSASSFRQ